MLSTHVYWLKMLKSYNFIIGQWGHNHMSHCDRQPAGSSHWSIFGHGRRSTWCDSIVYQTLYKRRSYVMWFSIVYFYWVYEYLTNSDLVVWQWQERAREAKIELMTGTYRVLILSSSHMGNIRIYLTYAGLRAGLYC